MSLLLRTNFGLAHDALKRNRGRSFLTCLGITIGVAAVILTLSLMGSAAHIIASGQTLAPESVSTIKLKDGEFVKGVDQTAVIGQTLSTELFGTKSPIGQTLKFFGQKFLITGIIDSDEPNLSSTAIISTKDNSSLPQTFRSSPIDKNFLAIEFADTNNNLLAGDNLQLFETMLVAVASVSILVGGIGIMNIMLVAVAERTHEIGIRKALGATNLNIATQFLFESLIISCLGGVLGLLLGYILATIFSFFTPFPPFLSVEILLAVLYISVVSGAVFGLYPALKAARKSPIDSLKSY